MKCFRLQSDSKDESSRRRLSTWWLSSSSSSYQSSRRSVSEARSNRPSDVSSASTILARESSVRPNNLRAFSFAELKEATGNFDVKNFLGEGGFGCVYKGWVRTNCYEEGRAKLEVAVKQLNARGHQGHKQWLSEIKYLGLANHPNLVKLLGYCAEDDDKGPQMLLVYEFMPNRSLEAHLFSKSLPVLPWQSRVEIALGTALGLAYLHEELEYQIIYRDFKTSNVLLDKDFIPKLSDFGLARQGPDVGASHVTTAVVGTMGYAAPEYVETGRLTSKSDVWSFGIVLLELLTGRKAWNSNLPKNEKWLLEWAKPYISDCRKVQKILDARLSEQYSLQAAQKLASLASHCLSKSAKSRPKMSQVVEKLKHILQEFELQHACSERWETAVIVSSDQTPDPRQRYLMFKEELNQKMREHKHSGRKGFKPHNSENPV